MNAQYRHSQPGYLSIVISLILIAFSGFIYLLGGLAAAIPMFLICLFILVFSYKLTVEIKEGFLKFWFGPGLFWKTIPLEQIAYCQPFKGVFGGWGIRYVFDGWLYNVSGFKAVTVVLKSGKKIHIGTDQPELLIEAINSAAHGAATEVSSMWAEVKADYLKRVEQALSANRHPRSFEILADVSSHLDSRFAELKPQEQTWENFQKITTEMGPPAEYAELVGDARSPDQKGVSAGFVIALIMILAAVAAGMVFLPKLLKKDDSNLSKQVIVNDPNLIGKWQTVDFVDDINNYKPGEKRWTGDFFLKQLIFYENGQTSGPWLWTKEEIIHPGDKTAAHYYIREMNGSTYLFFEWMSGDVTIRGMKPKFYVLQKVSQSTNEGEDQNANYPK